MWKNIAIAGATAAVVLGAGTAALAVSGNLDHSTPGTSGSGNSAQLAASAGSAAPSSSAKGHGPGLGPVRKALTGRLQNFEHGTWVSRSGNSTVDHSAVHGSVTKVSASSITVAAPDHTNMTFTVSKDTKVHTRAQQKGAAITSVKVGDTVFVTGTGSPTATAQQVIDAN
jgi:preprotein translocase subunit YajC